MTNLAFLPLPVVGVPCLWLVGLGFSFVIPRNAMTRDLFIIWDRIRFLAPLTLRIRMTSETGTVTCHEVLTTPFTVNEVPTRFNEGVIQRGALSAVRRVWLASAFSSPGFLPLLPPGFWAFAIHDLQLTIDGFQIFFSLSRF